VGSWLALDVTAKYRDVSLDRHSLAKLLLFLLKLLFQLKYPLLELDILAAQYENLFIQLRDPLEEFRIGESAC
jgi:hypothetical protein